MTPEELDRWSAEKVMGWTLNPPKFDLEKLRETGYGHKYHTPYYSYKREGKVDGAMLFNDWHPSDPTTGQIWMVIDKMRELEFNYAIKSWNKVVLVSIGKGRFRDKNLGLAEHSNPCIAILMAAYEAIEAPNPIP